MAVVTSDSVTAAAACPMCVCVCPHLAGGSPEAIKLLEKLLANLLRSFRLLRAKEAPRILLIGAINIDGSLQLLHGLSSPLRHQRDDATAV